MYEVVSIDETWFRLIPSRFPPVDIYQRIASPEDWGELHAIEEMTNPRVRERQWLTGLNRVDLGSPRLQNWNHAPFAYLNPEGSWLLDPFVGVLELSDCLQTALAASIRKRELFLSRTAEPPIDLDMRVLGHRVTGNFIDLTGMDPDLTQSERWQIGEAALRSDADGALFMCPYRRGAKCVSVFKGDALGKSNQHDHFRFVWDGVAIRTVYSFSSARALAANEIFSEQPIPRAA